MSKYRAWVQDEVSSINNLKIAEMEQRVNIIRERIKDRYDMDVPTEMVVDDEPDDLEMRIERINRSIESIGPINMAVQQEYEDEQTRLETLMEQRVDLITSEDNLRETIQKFYLKSWLYLRWFRQRKTEKKPEKFVKNITLLY